MPILYRYFLGEFLKVFAICLGSIVLVYFSIDFFGKIGLFLQKKAAWNLIFGYFFLRIPRIAFDVIPIATLLATLITLGFLSKNNEIVALKSHGVSILGAVSPILLFSLFVSLFLLGSNLYIIPKIKEKAEFIRVVKIKKRPEAVFYGTTELWLKDGPNRFLKVLWVDPPAQTIYQVGYYFLRDDFTLEKSLYAEKAVYRENNWVLLNGTERRFSSDGILSEIDFEERLISLKQKPEDFRGFDIKTDRMTFGELRQYIALMKTHGYSVSRFRVDLFDKILYPLASFVMALTAIPLGIFPVRGAGIARGVGLSLVLGTAYWIVYSLSVAMGHGEWIPPLLSAGLANLLFLCLGGYLFLGIRS